MERLNERWLELTKWFEKEFGMESDSQSMLFMIGVQELGKGIQKFNKTEKIELIHLGLCSILQKEGYYTFSHLDEDAWPHYENKKKLPLLKGQQQDQFIKEALIIYFEEIITAQKEI